MKFFGKPEFVMTLLVFIMSINFGFSADSIQIYSPNYFDEQNNVYEKINYLENEILSFEFCADKPPEDIKFLIIPENGKDFEIKHFTNSKKKNCYFTNYDLEKIQSAEFSLEVSYSVNNKNKIIKRKFEKQKQSKLINHVLSLDPEVLNSEDLSYYLTVLTDVESINSEKSIEAYEKLKEDRHNQNKCWPTSSCNILQTSKILRNLMMAGYSTNTRLLEDGEVYLNKFKISNENNPIKFEVEVDNSFVSNEKVVCSLQIDDEDSVNYEFDKDDKLITKYASETMKFSCNQSVEEIKLKIHTNTGSVKETKEFENSVGFTYSIEEFSCIGTGSNCDFKSTIDALITYQGGIEDSGLLAKYLDSLIIEDEDDNEISLDVSDEFESTGKYLYYKNNVDLVENLKFSQNNDGSWGTSSIYNDLIKTAWAVLGLQKTSSNSEHVDDGEKWIYFNEPTTGWGSVEKNALAYLAIKKQIKPYLKINAVSEISELTEFKITNPTIHNLQNVKVELSSELNDFVSYTQSLGDLDGKDSIEFDIFVNPDFYSELSGRMKITGVNGKNQEIVLIDNPVNLVGPQPISLVGGNYSYTPEVAFVNLRFSKNVPTFTIDCEYQNPFENTKESITITDKDYEISISNFALGQGEFDVELECSFEKNKFKTSTNISVTLAEKTFNVQDSITLYDLEDFSIPLNDTSSARQTLTFEFTGNFKNLLEAAETEKLIAIDDSRDLFFKVKNPIMLEALGNQSSGDLIIKSDSGYKKRIPILVNLSSEAESDGLSWWAWVLIILFIGFIGLVIFRFYEMKMHENQPAENESFDDDFYFE